MCDRHRGIGADGLMVLLPHPGADFRMLYFNADGSRAGMCGNGARCIALFARDMGLGSELRFVGDDGEHHATVFDDGVVRVGMRNVSGRSLHDKALVLDTGVPHYVEIVPSAEAVDVVGRGRQLRHDPRFALAGVNVNFVELGDGFITVRTYERGVEDETLACGTGAVASALATYMNKGLTSPIEVRMPGGILRVEFTSTPEGGFTNITLTGPARQVFYGEVKA